MDYRRNHYGRELSRLGNRKDRLLSRLLHLAPMHVRVRAAEADQVRVILHQAHGGGGAWDNVIHELAVKSSDKLLRNEPASRSREENKIIAAVTTCTCGFVASQSDGARGSGLYRQEKVACMHRLAHRPRAEVRNKEEGVVLCGNE